MAEENKECLKIVKDFYRDVLTVFPEYKDKLEEYEIEFLMEGKHGEKLYTFCLENYPQHFFNILYQNDDIFKDMKQIVEQSDIGVNFKQIRNTPNTLISPHTL